jgi:hypothetical protein
MDYIGNLGTGGFEEGKRKEKVCPTYRERKITYVDTLGI